MQALKSFDVSGENIRNLGSFRIFDGIAGDPNALKEFDRILTQKNFAPGEALIREGDTGDELFLLLSGEATVHKRTIDGDLYKVAILSAVEFPFFGEGAILGAEKRSATILAQTPCTCLCLGKNSFENLARNHPGWAYPVLFQVASSLMTKLTQVNHDLGLLYTALVTEIREG